MEICRETFLHADRRAASADVACHSEQFLQTHFFITRNHAYYVPGPVSVKDKRLEDTCDVLPQTVGYMLRREVVLSNS